jgi:peptide deformylase
MLNPTTLGGRLLKILTYPNPLLREKCLAVKSFPYESSILQLAADMLTTVKAQNGLGLAAPQVGSLSRLVALRIPAARTELEAKRLTRTSKKAFSMKGPHFIIAANPILLTTNDDEKTISTTTVSSSVSSPTVSSSVSSPVPLSFIGYEACLSIPGGGSLVRRDWSIRIRYELLASTDLEHIQRLRRISQLEEEEEKGKESQENQQHSYHNRALIIEERLEGLPAIVAQHEIDHLDGVLISDREVKHFSNSTYDREMDRAQLLFADGINKFYCDTQAYEDR